MKVSLCLFLFVMAMPLFPQASTKADIQYLDKRIDSLDKKIDLLREDMNQRFNLQRDELKILREDMNQRFNMLMWFIGILMAISTATISYMLNKIYKHDRILSTLDIKNFIAIIKADPIIKKELKEALR